MNKNDLNHHFSIPYYNFKKPNSLYRNRTKTDVDIIKTQLHKTQAIYLCIKNICTMQLKINFIKLDNIKIILFFMKPLTSS